MTRLAHADTQIEMETCVQFSICRECKQWMNIFMQKKVVKMAKKLYFSHDFTDRHSMCMTELNATLVWRQR